MGARNILVSVHGRRDVVEMTEDDGKPVRHRRDAKRRSENDSAAISAQNHAQRGECGAAYESLHRGHAR
jgi:hypothetical protein